MSGLTKWYGVAVGRQTGVYASWSECEQQVRRYSGAVHKSFKSRAEASAFVDRYSQARAASSGAAPEAPAAKRRRKIDADVVAAAPSAATTAEAPAAAEVAEDRPASDAEPDSIAAANVVAAPAAAALPPVSASTLYRLEFDGASRGNPGLAGAGAVLMEDASRQEVGSLVLALQRQTNNVAEYCGLIVGLEAAVQLGIKRLLVIGDSLLIVRQVAGQYQCKNEGLQPLLARVRELKANFHFFSIQHVLREHNKLADALSNEALDGVGWGGGLKLPNGEVAPIASSLPALLRGGGSDPKTGSAGGAVTLKANGGGQKSAGGGGRMHSRQSPLKDLCVGRHVIASGTSLFGVQGPSLGGSMSQAGHAGPMRGLAIAAAAAAGAPSQPLQRAAAGTALAGAWSSCHGGRLPDSFGALCSTCLTPAEAARPVSSSTAGHSAGRLSVQHGGQARQCSFIEAACQQAASIGASTWQPWRRHSFGDVSLSRSGRSGLAASPLARSWSPLQPRAVIQLAACRSGAVRQAASTAVRHMSAGCSVLHCRRALRMLIR